MKSTAKSPEEYLKGLPEDRRLALTEVRKVILKKLPKGYEEGMQYGMITYQVPLSLYPKGYAWDKKTPLPYVSIASQKNHMAIYILATYGNSDLNKWFRDEYVKTGKKLDMGMGCLRFKKVDDLALPLIGELVSKTSAKAFSDQYEEMRSKLKKK